MSKLIIHQTDSHGSGKYLYNGKVESYYYDGDPGDMAAAVQALINIGFIKSEDVMIIEDDEIYKYLNFDKEEEEDDE